MYIYIYIYTHMCIQGLTNLRRSHACAVSSYRHAAASVCKHQTIQQAFFILRSACSHVYSERNERLRSRKGSTLVRGTGSGSGSGYWDYFSAGYRLMFFILRRLLQTCVAPAPLAETTQGQTLRFLKR